MEVFLSLFVMSANQSSAGAGGGQSHQCTVAQTPQSVQTHTPQTSVPSQVLAQHVAAGVARKSAGNFLLTSTTCTLNDRLPRVSFVKLLSTSRVSTAFIVSAPLCCTACNTRNSTLPLLWSRMYGVIASFFPSLSTVIAPPSTAVTLAQ